MTTTITRKPIQVDYQRDLEPSFIFSSQITISNPELLNNIEDITETLKELELQPTEVLKIRVKENTQKTKAIAIAKFISYKLMPLFSAIAIEQDPDKGFIIFISTHSKFEVGKFIP